MDKRDLYPVLKAYFRVKNHAWLTGQVDDVMDWHEESHVHNTLNEVKLRKQTLELRGIRDKKTTTDVRVTQSIWDPIREEWKIQLTEQVMWIYQEGSDYQDEARQYVHTMYWRPSNGLWKIVHSSCSREAKEHRGIVAQAEEDIERSNSIPILPDREYKAQNRWRGNIYDRVQVMKYAELWWDRYNPAYRKFEVDCTSFASQCIFAGRAPMFHVGNRRTGWWYRHGGGSHDNWSYSWSVANSFRHVLPNPHNPWHVDLVENATELKIGNVICYDWDGNGVWQHNTVIVGFDQYSRPLVNAHTVNSHRRYWEYRDSYAFTSRTKYAFFRMPDSF